jgi:molybdopterin-guanine dinucleotide biosynthesis protein A
MGEAADGRLGSGPPVGAVLAGGRGNRIGGAKALVELAGAPLISYPLAAVEQAGLEPVVVAKRHSELPPLSCRVIREPAQPRHPLCGIVAALRYAGPRPLVVVGCDMPFADAGLLAWLGSAPEPLVVPSVGDRLQALLARYDSALLPALEEALADGRALRPALESLQPRTIAEAELARFGDPRRLCFNVNTPTDVEEAERLLEPAGR